MQYRIPAFVALITLVASTGCPPQRDQTPGLDGSQSLAVLASGIDGIGTDIVVFDGAGQELDRIETDIDWAQGLGYHPDGYFLVGDEGHLQRVNLDGSSERFTQEPVWGGFFGISVSDEGEVTVGNAEDGITKIDKEGEVIIRATMGDTCFMDTTPMPNDPGLDASVDIYGSQIVSVDSESGAITPLITGVGYEIGLVTSLGGKRFIAAEYYGTALYAVDGEDSVALPGRQSALGQTDALPEYVVGLAPAGRDSAVVLYETQSGSTLGMVDISGDFTELAAAAGERWSDVVSF